MTIYADNTPYEISVGLSFEILEALRLAHIYILKDSHLEELPDDFKPYKWINEIEFAQSTIDLFHRLIEEMQNANKPTLSMCSKRKIAILPKAGWHFWHWR